MFSHTRETSFIIDGNSNAKVLTVRESYVTPGYTTYLLWLMAGEHQGFNRSNDEEHTWILEKVE